MMLSLRSSGVILLVLSLLHLTFCAVSSPSFSWADCGVQLNKAIHYQSVSISPQTANQNAGLSVNVQATIADIIYDAETRLMVWKDGDLFLDVYIDKLCNIIGDTNALTCPLYPGVTSFTYEFDSVPALPSGQYVIHIKSEIASFDYTFNEEIGCVAFTGTVDGLTATNNCTYTSKFNVRLQGSATYTNAQRDQRVEGDSIQIGPIVGSADTSPYGTFVGDYTGTNDVGGTISTHDYNWALNGTLMSHNVDATSQRIIDIYYGTFFVLYQQNSIYFAGKFNWTFDYDPSRSTNVEQVSGQMWLDPEYSVIDDEQWTWPVVVGNLGPFSVKTLGDGTFLVEGSHDFCTCGLDACGKCGGDGRSCGLGVIHHDSDGWGTRKKAAVACGVVAFCLILLVLELSRRIRKEKRRIPIHDEDLVDHPEKPDYGTMAIDDAIREGERVV